MMHATLGRLTAKSLITCVISAPRALVFKAWSDPVHLPLWFGPAGFTVETQEIEIRVGGKWRFVLVAPDGTRYDSRVSVFLKIDAPRFLELDHGSDKDDDPGGKFRVIVTFDEQTDGKTVLTLRQLHPTKEQRDATIGFGVVEFGYQTLEKLAQHIACADDQASDAGSRK